MSDSLPEWKNKSRPTQVFSVNIYFTISLTEHSVCLLTLKHVKRNDKHRQVLFILLGGMKPSLLHDCSLLLSYSSTNTDLDIMTHDFLHEQLSEKQAASIKRIDVPGGNHFR